MFFFISLYLQQVLGYDALKAGLAYLPLALTIIVSAGVASQLVTRVGLQADAHRRAAVHRGRAAVVLARVAPGGTYVGDVLFPSLLAAIGLGFAFVPVTIARGDRARSRDEAGLASGLINTAQQVGGALGLAILVVDRQPAGPTQRRSAPASATAPWR